MVRLSMLARTQKAPSTMEETSQSAGAVFSPIPGAVFEIERLDFYYGSVRALKSVTLDIPGKQATALIGPSGCGKTTLLRCLNRMNDLIPNVTVSGSIKLHGSEIYAAGMDVIDLRRRVGMIFQKWNPFPKSIYENVVYGLKIAGITNRQILDEVVEKNLRRAALWDEVKDHVLPYSTGGILTGVIIALSRAIGETAPLITIGALTFIAFLPDPPVKTEFPFLSFQWLASPFTVMPIQIFNWVSRPQHAFHFNAAAAAIVLTIMTLAMNALAIYIRYRFRKRVRW